MSTNARLASLRAILHGTPSVERWWALCRGLESCPEGDELDLAREYGDHPRERGGWPGKRRQP
ncbi:MAG: hypothetical protein AAFS10_25570, partial [Myxococcota bacterium]